MFNLKVKEGMRLVSGIKLMYKILTPFLPCLPLFHHPLHLSFLPSFLPSSPLLRLYYSMLVDRIDTDKDGFVTEKELQDWVGHVAKR